MNASALAQQANHEIATWLATWILGLIGVFIGGVLLAMVRRIWVALDRDRETVRALGRIDAVLEAHGARLTGLERSVLQAQRSPNQAQSRTKGRSRGR